MSIDGGEHWVPATIDRGSPDDPWAWRAWSWDWTAEPGEHTLCCRARDASGGVQPVDERWNVHGYANNAVQRVAVTVQPDVNLSELPDLLDRRPVRSELVYLLVLLDKEYTEAAPTEPWPDYYARRLIEHFS